MSVDLESPRGAFRAIDPRFGNRIVLEMPCLRVPFQRLVQPVGNAAKLADRDGTRADFNVSGGTTARADAVEPVADMAAAIWQLEVTRHGGRIDEQVGGIAADPVAADADFAVRSDECDAISAAFKAASIAYIASRGGAMR